MEQAHRSSIMGRWEPPAGSACRLAFCKPCRRSCGVLLPVDYGWYNLCMLATLMLAGLLGICKVQMGPVTGYL